MNAPLRRFFLTSGELAPFVVRVVLGLVFLPHGLQKTLGLFGGHGFSGTMGHFTSAMGLPAVLAFLVILCESAGSVSLILGFATRFCALSLAGLMAGAVVMVHWQHGFFMNWFGKQAGEGFEYHLLAIGMALSLVLTGGGRFSIDRALSKET